MPITNKCYTLHFYYNDSVIFLVSWGFSGYVSLHFFYTVVYNMWQWAIVFIVCHTNVNNDRWQKLYVQFAVSRTCLKWDFEFGLAEFRFRDAMVDFRNYLLKIGKNVNICKNVLFDINNTSIWWNSICKIVSKKFAKLCMIYHVFNKHLLRRRNS